MNKGLSLSNSMDCYHSYLRLVKKGRRKLKNIVGKKIHLKTLSGMYTVSEYKHPILVITCKRWQALADYGVIKNAFREVYVGDFKCLAGGIHNLNLS